MERILFESHHAASLQVARDLRQGLDATLRHFVPDAQTANRIRLLLSEAVTNLIEHADPAPSRIGIRFGRNSTHWWLEVIDDGAFWNPIEQAPPLPVVDEFSLLESGRGLSLLFSQCDQVHYDRSTQEQCNRLRLSWEMPDRPVRPRVLIVDDDASQSRLYAAYIAAQFEAVIANDGLEALEHLRSGQIHLVLSDICMPNMNGMQLREQLDQHQHGTLTPFIFLTGLADSFLPEQAARLGVDDFLRKPVNKATLLCSIERALERSRQLQRTLSDRLEKQITGSLTPTVPDAHRHWKLALGQRDTGVGGGDFLLHADDDDTLTLILADIMGHDVSAKFFSHAYAGYLRGLLHAGAHGQDPAHLLKLLSTSAWQDRLFSQITLTACLLCLHESGGVTLASAAHPPALLVREQHIETVTTGGILPGLMPEAHYEAVSFTLAKGERLAVYTDGLLESSPTASGRKMLESAIRQSLLDTRGQPIEEALRATMGVFDRLAGCPTNDDALLLLIEPR